MELDYSEMGTRVARRRRSMGLKQVELCEQVGISDKYLSYIERANAVPSLDVLMRLTQALDVTPDDILFGNTGRTSDEWRDVAELLRDMSPGQLEMARRFLFWLSTEKMPPIVTDVEETDEPD